MININLYILEKLHLDKDTEVDNSYEKVISEISDYLKDKFHYNIDEDFTINIDEKKKMFYIYIDWIFNGFDNFSFSKFFKSIQAKITDIIDNICGLSRQESWYTFGSKEKRMIFRVNK